MPADDLFSQPPAVVQSAEDLAKVCEEAKAHKHTHEVTGRQSLDAFRRLGKSLIKIKEMVPHGEFEKTVTTRIGVSPRVAQRAMRVVRHWDEVHSCETIEEALAWVADTKEDDPKASSETLLTGHEKAGSGRKSNSSKKKDEKPVSPILPTTETPVERVQRKINEIVEQLTDVTVQIGDVLKSPIGIQMLSLADELRVEIKKEFVGEEDKFGRASDIRGERHLYPVPLLKMVEFLTTFSSRLANPSEVDF